MLKQEHRAEQGDNCSWVCELLSVPFRAGVPWIVSSPLFTRWVFSTLVHDKESEPQRSCVLPEGRPGRTWRWLRSEAGLTPGLSLLETPWVGLFYQQCLPCAGNLSRGGSREQLMRNDQLSLGQIPVASKPGNPIDSVVLYEYFGWVLPSSVHTCLYNNSHQFWKGKGYLPHVKSLLKGLFVLEQINLKRNELCKVVSNNRFVVKERISNSWVRQ